MSSASFRPGRRLFGRAGRRSRILCVFAAVAPACLVASAADAGASYLFATPGACIASGRFSRDGCKNAFANSQVELREKVQSFATRRKCQSKYRLCEKDADAGEAYRPTLLGVEIAVGGREPSATPILAVETPPRMFAALPISRAIEPVKPVSEGFAPIGPVGRFRAKAERAAEVSHSRDEAIVDVDASTMRAPAPPMTRESSAERRRRLRAAPFVE